MGMFASTMKIAGLAFLALLPDLSAAVDPLTLEEWDFLEYRGESENDFGIAGNDEGRTGNLWIVMATTPSIMLTDANSVLPDKNMDDMFNMDPTIWNQFNKHDPEDTSILRDDPMHQFINERRRLAGRKPSQGIPRRRY